MRVKTGTLAEMVLGAASVDMIDMALIGAPAKITPHRIRQMTSVLQDQPLPPRTALISRHHGCASPNLLESPFAQPTRAIVATVHVKHLLENLGTVHTPTHDAIVQI